MLHFLGGSYCVFMNSPSYDFKSMPDCCHVSLTCAVLMRVCILFSSFYINPVLLLSPFGRLEDKPEIDDDIFLCPFARLRWLRVLEGELCSVSRLALYQAAMPNMFLSFFFVSLLSAPLYLIAAVECDSSFYCVYSCIITIVCV